MSTLARRRWYVAALALIFGAIAARLLAMHHAKCGMMAMARASAFPEDRLRLREVAYWHVHRYGLWDLIGLGFATVAVSSWLVSRKRRELGSQGLLLVLLGLYVLLFLLTV